MTSWLPVTSPLTRIQIYRSSDPRQAFGAKLLFKEVSCASEGSYTHQFDLEGKVVITYLRINLRSKGFVTSLLDQELKISGFLFAKTTSVEVVFFIDFLFLKIS